MTSKKFLSSIMCSLLLVSSFCSVGTVSLAAEPEPEMVGMVLVNGDQSFDSDSAAITAANQHRWLSYPASRIQINPGIRPALGSNLALKVGLFVNGVRNLTSNANASFQYYYAEFAVDGNASTRWAPASVNNQWICVDLESIEDILKIVISWESAYGRSYRIDVSTTGTADSDFTTIIDNTNGRGGTETLTFNPVKARYIRLYNRTSSNSSWGASVYEFEIYSE